MTLYWYLRSRLFEWKQQRHVERAFYSNPTFFSIDQTLLALYKNESPFAISKAYLEKRGAKDPHLYGETPLSTVHQMATRFGLTSDDCLIELGAGRCRAAFFLATVIGCRVIAVEQIPEFVQKARAVSCPRVTLIEGDYFQADFSSATAIFLYGSHLSDGEIARLTHAFQKIPSSVKIFTVSDPLPGFEVAGQMTGQFPWGKTEIYWNRRIM